ncbi:capsular biosynthesis protein, partial [Aduncisulcus paluster]
GKFGKAAKDTAETLLRHDMYHFVGSDAHRPTRDSKFMGRELNCLRDLVSGSTYDAITEGNPYAVIINSDTITSNHTRYLPLSFVQQFLGKFRRHSA